MLKASCHCGAVALAIDGTVPDHVTRCTCSFCSKRGSLWAYYEPSQVEVKTSTGDAIYRWQSRLVAHHFCKICGCGAFSDSPAFQSDGQWDGTTRRIGVNARLIEDFDAAEAPVTVIDGKNLW